MTTPLASVKTQIATDWEALTPPDRTDHLYHQVDGRLEPGWDRAFWFDHAHLLRPTGWTAGATTADWLLHIEIQFCAAERSLRDYTDATENCVTQLRRAINTRGTWAAGVYGVQADTAIPVRGGGLEDVTYRFTVRVRTSEAD